MIPVKVHSVATDESQEHFYAVLTSEGEQQEQWLPLQIGPSEAVSIASELNEEGPERPQTHDLIRNAIEELGASVDRVVLDRTEGTVKATVAVSTSAGDSFELEARPSDALAIGIRTNAELKVSESLMNQASRSSEHFVDRFANAHPSPEVTQLQYELQQAIDDEDYERAAELKEEIKSAARRHDESLDLDEGLTEELRQAYHGSRETDTEES